MGPCHCFGSRKEQEEEAQIERNGDQTRVVNVAINSEVDDAKKKAMAFSYRELATATNNFREESVIGEGGFGPVYRGKFETSGQIIAVKKLNHWSSQGDKEFLVEVVMLSLLRHPNLVHLIGYCAEGDQRLLVYEFMPFGSLESRLHGGPTALNWNTRMMIAAGAAKGLSFLHNEAHPPIIFRDLKSPNILLDDAFHPKLSDFGLAKFGPKSQGHSTRVMGTAGYCAPEYAATGNLTIKSDIYSFGIVLLELISGCRPIDMMTQGNGKHMLIHLARPLLKKESEGLVSLVDPKMEGDFSVGSLRKAMEVALMCVEDDPGSRPSMNDVVKAMNNLTSGMHRPNAVVSPVHDEGEGEDEDENEETRPVEEQQRAVAVADAKMWGETWRDKDKNKHHQESSSNCCN
ncbi:hypothetical protein ACS0TY_030612 [Phlomoides rotata]